MADKARAARNDTLGEYIYGETSGLDRRLLEGLGTSEKAFADAAESMPDSALGNWLREKWEKTDDEIKAFNQHHLGREPDHEGGRQRLKQRLDKFAPGRTDITTSFQSIELDDWGSFCAVDLTARPPRTPYDRSVAHTCGLARMADKARADKAGKLNDYIYDCPIDQAVMAFLDLSADAFQEAAWNNPNDSELGDWVTANTSKSQPDIAAFNVALINRGPEGAEELDAFNKSMERAAPGRADVSTWFQMLDLDDQSSYGLIDLARRPPRSPYDRSIIGAVGIARIVDKGRAHLTSTIGDYWFGPDSGADKAALRSLGVSMGDVQQALEEHATDEAFEKWLLKACAKSDAEIAAYNEEMIRRGPPSERAWKWFRPFVASFDPARTDLTTYYQIMEYHDHITFARLHSGI
jgi:hypothetical protein